MHTIKFKYVEKEKTKQNTASKRDQQSYIQSEYLKFKGNMYMKLANFSLNQSQLTLKTGEYDRLALSSGQPYKSIKDIISKNSSSLKVKKHKTTNFLINKTLDDETDDGITEKDYQQYHEYKQYMKHNIAQLIQKIEQPLSMSLCQDDAIQFSINILDFIFQPEYAYDKLDCIIKTSLQTEQQVRVDRNLIVDNQERKKQLQNAAIFNGQIIKYLNSFSKFIKFECINIDIVNNMLDNILQFQALNQLFQKDHHEFINQINQINKMQKIYCNMSQSQTHIKLTKRQQVQLQKEQDNYNNQYFKFDYTITQNQFLTQFQTTLRQILVKTYFLLLCKCQQFDITQDNLQLYVNQIQTLQYFVSKHFSNIQIFYNKNNEYIIVTKKSTYILNDKKEPYRQVFNNQQHRREIQKFMSKLTVPSFLNANYQNILYDIENTIMQSGDMLQLWQDASQNFDIMNDYAPTTNVIPENSQHVHERKIQISNQITKQLQPVTQQYEQKSLQTNNFAVFQQQHIQSQKYLNTKDLNQENHIKQKQPVDEDKEQSVQNDDVAVAVQIDDPSENITTQQQLNDHQSQIQQEESIHNILQKSGDYNQQILDLSHINPNNQAEASEPSMLSIEQMDVANDQTELPIQHSQIPYDKSQTSIYLNDKPTDSLTQEEAKEIMSGLQQLLQNSQRVQEKVNSLEQSKCKLEGQSSLLMHLNNNSVVNMYQQSQSAQEMNNDVTKIANKQKQRKQKKNKQKRKQQQSEK